MTELDDAGWRALYALLRQVAKRTDAAIVVVHHASRGEQDKKGVSESGSGSGVMNRGCSTCVVINRPKGTDPDDNTHAVLRAVTRSFPQPEVQHLKLATLEGVGIWEIDAAATEAAQEAEKPTEGGDQLAAARFASVCARPDAEPRHVIEGRRRHMRPPASAKRAQQLFDLALGAGHIKRAPSEDGRRRLFRRNPTGGEALQAEQEKAAQADVEKRGIAAAAKRTKVVAHLQKRGVPVTVRELTENLRWLGKSPAVVTELRGLVDARLGYWIELNKVFELNRPPNPDTAS